MCDRRAGVLFVSIESFLALNAIIDPATVGAMVLEETCELASKMLSATCPCARPFRLLRTVAAGAERVIYTDADFEADGPTDGRCLRLAKYLCPDLPVRIFSLSRSAEHTKRGVKLFFDHADAETTQMPRPRRCQTLRTRVQSRVWTFSVACQDGASNLGSPKMSEADGD